MFVIGLALAGALGIPLTNEVFRTQEWLFRDLSSALLGSIFLRGAIETFILYATVRYFIFDSPEFDERTDGVIYGTAAGLGYATAANLRFILASGGAELGSAGVYVAEVALAYAAFGGVIGYFLGHAKVQQDPPWWLPLGFVVTALLNGVFTLLSGQLETGSLSLGAAASRLPTLAGFVLSAIFVVLITVILAWLVNRDVAAAASGQLPQPSGDPTASDRQANALTIVVSAVMFIIGVFGWNSAVSSTSFEAAGIRGAYPAYFSIVTKEGEAFRVADRMGSGVEFALRVVTLSAGDNIGTITALLASERAANNLTYRVVRTAEETIRGKPATVQEFAWVDPGGLTGAIPRVIQGLDYIFVSENRAVIATLVATPATIGEAEPLFKDFVNSLSF
jgi:RsiW-degrading membrane proteinase PrsW (M82 family)